MTKQAYLVLSTASCGAAEVWVLPAEAIPLAQALGKLTPWVGFSTRLCLRLLFAKQPLVAVFIALRLVPLAKIARAETSTSLYADDFSNPPLLHVTPCTPHTHP